MPVAATTRRRRWLAAALATVTGPAFAVAIAAHPAYAVSDEQRLAQLQHAAATANTDIGVRDATAQKAALALLQIDAQLTSAKHVLAGANHKLADARKVLTARRAGLASAQNDELAAQAAVNVATTKYDTARDALRLMLRSAFEQGVGGDLDAIMQGGTPDQLADRVGLLDQLSSSRQSRLRDLGTARDALTRQENILTAARLRAQNAVVAADTEFTNVSNDQQAAQDATARLVSLQHSRQGAVNAAKTAAAAAHKRYSELEASSLRLQEILAARASSQGGFGGLSTGSAGGESAGGLVMPTIGVFTSGFGYRVDPFGLGTTFHAGQDIAAPTGTRIVAATAGIVAIVETPGQSGGYGNYTCIDRGAGFATCYAHQSAVFVHVGQIVAQGQLIGLVGSTGASTGPHLHFEVRINGVPVNPLPYLP